MSQWLRIVLCLVVCSAGYALLQEAAVRFSRAGYRSGPETNRHKLAGTVAAVIVGIQFACLFMLLTARPFMAMILTLSLLGLLLVINRVKESVLLEPLVIADAWLLPQVFRYPEMYIPFMPMKEIAAGGVLLVLFLAGLLYAEPIAPFLRSWCGASLCAFIAFVPALMLWLMRKGKLFFLASRLLRLLPVSHDAKHDAAHIGPLAAAVMHPLAAGIMEREQPEFLLTVHKRPAASRLPEPLESVLKNVEGLAREDRPHVILLQAESFCDVREHFSGAQKEALQHFLPGWDALNQSGGALPTPEGAYGAYTMRTEFSMLTGLSGENLGVFSFNPYILAAQKPLWSLAHFFSSFGYETICVHPYHKGFFQRDMVMENLGFNQFLGLEELADLPTCGPYASDVALGHTITQKLADSPAPVFLFGITMEAHGPWREGRVSKEVLEQEGTSYDRKLFNTEQNLYLYHLKHMDTLILSLLEEESPACKRIVIAYGDHLPGCL